MAFRFAARGWDRTTLEKGDCPLFPWKKGTVPLFAATIAATISMAGPSAQTPPRSGLQITRVFGPEVPTGRYKHPASITELRNGDLYLVYYGGAGEYAMETSVFGARRKKGTSRLDGPAGHRARPLPIAGKCRRLAGARRSRLALLRRPIRGDVVHVAHPGQGVPGWRGNLVRLVHDQPGRRHDGQEPADRPHER